MPPSSKFGRRRRRCRRSRRLQWERLEDLTLLSAYLYLDYGDGFAGGALQGVTLADLKSHAAADGVVINGPDGLTDNQDVVLPDATSLMLASFASVYSGAGTSAADVATMRATITGLVKRAYEPLDVTVIDLTTAGTTVNGKTVTAAASLDDVSRTLAASGNNHDSYVFAARTILGGTVANATTDPTQYPQNGYGGIASGLDIGKTNANAGVALAFLNVARYDLHMVAQTIVHEAGHLFGLAHAWRTDQGTQPSLEGYLGQLDAYHGVDVMSYLTTGVSVDVFSRSPIVAAYAANGDGVNRDPSLLAAPPTPYDHLKADPNVGAKSNIEYVTGTGAHDVITIAKTGPTTAMVTIQPFLDAARSVAINIPGQSTASYSYTIDTTKSILVDGGVGNDEFVVDGDLGTQITIRGDTWRHERSGKASALIVRGKGAASASYSPTANKDDGLAGGENHGGSIIIGAAGSVNATTITFAEFTEDGGVTISDVQDLRYATPAAPAAATGGATLTIEGPEADRNRISGFSRAANAPLIPLTFFNVANFTIDAAAFGGPSVDDEIILDDPGLIAAGLKNFTITGGGGNDVMKVAANAGFAMPVSGGEFVFDAGFGRDPNAPPAFADQMEFDPAFGRDPKTPPPPPDPSELDPRFRRDPNARPRFSDRFEIIADVDMRIRDGATPREAMLSIAPAGSGLAGSAALGTLRLIGVGEAVLTGGAAGNRLDGSGFSGALTLAGDAGDDVLIGGSGTNRLHAGAGDDVMIAGPGGGTDNLVGGPGRNVFRADANESAVLTGDGDENVFIIENSSSGTAASTGGITIEGRGKAGDVLRLEGSGGAEYDQTYLLAATPGAGCIVTTIGQGSDGPMASRSIRFSGIETIDDSMAVNEIMFLSETALAPIDGIGGVDLAAGDLHPTVGGLAFGRIAIANKASASIRRVDDPVAPPPEPPVIVAPRPPLAPPIAVEPPVASSPSADVSARPGPMRLPDGRPIAWRRRLPRRAAPEPERPPIRFPSPRVVAIAPRGAMRHLRRV